MPETGETPQMPDPGSRQAEPEGGQDPALRNGEGTDGPENGAEKGGLRIVPEGEAQAPGTGERPENAESGGMPQGPENGGGPEKDGAPRIAISGERPEKGGAQVPETGERTVVFTITEETAIERQEGDSTVPAGMEEIRAGSVVEVTLQGDEAVRVVIR